MKNGSITRVYALVFFFVRPYGVTIQFVGKQFPSVLSSEAFSVNFNVPKRFLRCGNIFEEFAFCICRILEASCYIIVVEMNFIKMAFGHIIFNVVLPIAIKDFLGEQLKQCRELHFV